MLPELLLFVEFSPQPRVQSHRFLWKKGFLVAVAAAAKPDKMVTLQVLVFLERASPGLTSYPGCVEGAQGLFLLCQQEPKKYLLGSVRLSSVCG